MTKSVSCFDCRYLKKATIGYMCEFYKLGKYTYNDIINIVCPDY